MALWALTPMRKPWLFLNLGILVCAYFGGPAFPGIIERRLAPFSIGEIRTSQGTFGPDLAKSGIKVQTTDRIIVAVSGHNSDGAATLDCRLPMGSL